MRSRTQVLFHGAHSRTIMTWKRTKWPFVVRRGVPSSLPSHSNSVASWTILTASGEITVGMGREVGYRSFTLPNYDYYRRLIRETAKRMNISLTAKFDWQVEHFAWVRNVVFVQGNDYMMAKAARIGDLGESNAASVNCDTKLYGEWNSG